MEVPFKISKISTQLTPSGVVSATTSPSQEELSPLLFIFTDILSIDSEGRLLNYEDNRTLSKLVEQWIGEHLSKKTAPLEVKDLTEAFAYANKRLLQSEATGLNQVAASVLLAVRDQTSSRVLVATVGDSSLYQLTSCGLILLSADPENSHLSKGLTPETRLFGLTNTIGAKEELLLHTISIEVDQPLELVCATYGLLDHAREKELLQALLSPSSEQALRKLLEKCPSQGHIVELSRLTLTPGNYVAPIPSLSNECAGCPSARDSLRQRRLTGFGLSAAACALLLGTAALLVGTKDPETRVASEPTIDASFLAYNDDARDAKEPLEQALKEKKQQSEIIAFLQNQLEENTRQISDMEERLASASAQNTPVGPSVEQQASFEELIQAKKQVGDLEQTLLTLKEQLSARPAHAELSAYKEESSQLANSLEELTAKNQELSTNLATLRIQNQRLELNLAAQQREQAQLATIEQRYQGVVLEERAASKRIKDQETLIHELTDSLKQQKGLITKLESSRNELKNNLDSLRNEHQIALSTSQHNGARNHQTHLVTKGETLSGISSRYYGTSKRWASIYEANKALITDANDLKPGTKLVIPME